MATTPAAAYRQVEIGRIISRGFAVIGRAPGTMFGIALLFGAVPQAIISLVNQVLRTQAMSGLRTGADPDAFRGMIVVTIATSLLSLVFTILAQGALVRATITAAEGKPARFGESASTGFMRLLPLLVLSIIVVVACTFGLLLLIVPGVMLYVVWSVATPALVAERIGIFAALGRSARLTKGARWTIFGLQCIILVFYMIVSSIIGAVMVATIGLNGMASFQTNTSVANGNLVLFVILTALVSTITLVVWGAIQTSLYIELRTWKDGPAAERLADIFA